MEIPKAHRDSARWLRILEVLPGSGRLLQIIWPFLVIVVLLVWLSSESLSIAAAGRGYVEGESIWSKAHNEAVFHLLRYAETRQPSDYQKYRDVIAIPLGDRRARIELQKPNPDYAAVWQGFIEGKNHPDDIPHAIKLFRRFQHFSPMKDVIATWEAGDREFDRLIESAEQLQRRISRGETNPANIRPLIQHILEIHQVITPLNERFSKLLGETTRKTQFVLLILNFTVAGILLPIGMLLSHRMLRHSEEFEKRLKLIQERFNLAVTGSNDGLWDWNIVTGEMYYSPRFEQLLGYYELELGNSMDKLMSRVHPEDKVATDDAFSSHLKHRAPFDVEIRLQTKLGNYRWFRSRGQSVRDMSGKANRMAGSITDMTDRRQAAADLFAEKERALVTLASIADGVITTDTGGWIEYLNPVAEQLTGWTTAKARGLPMRDVLRMVDESSRKLAPNPIEMVLREERTIGAASTMLLVRNDGTEIPIMLSGAPIRARSDDSSGDISGVVLVLHDVSRERQYVAKLSYQASHDSLTGLINRGEFERRLNLALKSAAQLGSYHAVMYLDLDQFKVVNDTCGHAAGDQLMRQVSAVLQRRLRERDTLARLGGDEFGVLLENCAPDNALRIAEGLRQTVMECHFAWETRSFNIGVSIGLVNVDDGLFTLTDVLSAADSACYMAKEKGRNRVQVYHAGDSELSIRQGEMEWIGRLQKALEEDRFVLYSQEIAGLDVSREPEDHCEILIRMLDERGELVLPMAFIPAAERYNLMPSIDRWVIRNAFAIIAGRQADKVGKPGIFAINLSGASIGDEHFLEYVREQFDHFAVAPQSICFEITETAAIAKLDKAAYFINQLKSVGCLFSLDDFGAGMSSFAYLKHLPVDFLKIDGGFVKDMADDPIDRAMVEAINSVGHVMGKRTIAEFVDGDRVIRMLREMGVDFAQGYGVGKPQPFGPRLRVAASG